MTHGKLDFQGWLRRRAEHEVENADDALGEAFFEEVAAATDIETSGWAFELAHRAAARIQAGDPEAARKTPVVFWSAQRTAFAVPGKRIYLGRRLLEESMPEDAVAFTFAHELAHHRLGHVQTLLPALRVARRVPGVGLVSVVAMGAARLVSSRHNEAAADRWALERCVKAGYDGAACLRIFDVLRRIAEDHHDLDMAHGPGDVERAAAGELLRDEQAPWKNRLSDLGERVSRVQWEVLRGYPSLRERRERLAAHLATLTSNTG